ncbi:hypothetical protein ZWY2020_013307 [Hordeum vulgare]|nr:hypothetical protein ZWY2020_013307 [Hordeum vulgare]
MSVLRFRKHLENPIKLQAWLLLAQRPLGQQQRHLLSQYLLMLPQIRPPASTSNGSVGGSKQRPQVTLKEPAAGRVCPISAMKCATPSVDLRTRTKQSRWIPCRRLFVSSIMPANEDLLGHTLQTRCNFYLHLGSI